MLVDFFFLESNFEHLLWAVCIFEFVDFKS